MTARHLSIAIVAALLALTPAAPAEYMDLIHDLQPISLWRLGEASGTTAADQVGGVNGTYHGGQQGYPGAVANDPDTSVWFRPNNYVEIPHADSYRLDSGTVQLWYRDTGTIREQGLFSKDSCGFDTGGHLTIRTTTGGVEARLQSATQSHWVYGDPYKLNCWYLVTFTFGDGGMKLYIDDELVDTDEYTGGLAATSGGDGNFEPIVLGANAHRSGDRCATPLDQYLSGALDDVAVYDYALTRDQIAQVYRVATGDETYIPEPASAGILLIGGVAALCRRRRTRFPAGRG